MDSAAGSVTGIREQLEAIYREHRPEKIADVDGLLAEWAGKEAQLLAEVQAKYLPFTGHKPFSGPVSAQMNAEAADAKLHRDADEAAEGLRRRVERERRRALRPVREDDPPLRPVEKLFALFDVNNDGLLDKDEYKEYLKGIGAWGSNPSYTEEHWDERWPGECEDMLSTPAGIRLRSFEEILYIKFRAGKADEDLERCKTRRSGTPVYRLSREGLEFRGLELEPEPEPRWGWDSDTDSEPDSTPTGRMRGDLQSFDAAPPPPRGAADAPRPRKKLDVSGRGYTALRGEPPPAAKGAAVCARMAAMDRAQGLRSSMARDEVERVHRHIESKNGEIGAAVRARDAEQFGEWDKGYRWKDERSGRQKGSPRQEENKRRPEELPMEVSGLVGRAAVANGVYRPLPPNTLDEYSRRVVGQRRRAAYAQAVEGKGCRLVHDDTPGRTPAWVIELPPGEGAGKAYAYVEDRAFLPSDAKATWEVWECSVDAPPEEGEWCSRSDFRVAKVEAAPLSR